MRPTSSERCIMRPCRDMECSSQATSSETSGDSNVQDFFGYAKASDVSSVPDCTQPNMEVPKSVDDHFKESEAVSCDSTDDSDDSSSDSESNSEGSKDTGDSSSGGSDSESEAANAAVEPQEQPALSADGEQAAPVSPTEDQGADEVEVDSMEEEVELQMGAEEELKIHREVQNRILCQVQEQIASAIYGLQIADSRLGEEEFMRDLQMAVQELPDGPQDAPEQFNQEELPEQPLLSSEAAAAAAVALSDGVHTEHAADEQLADGTPSSSRNIEIAVAIEGSPTAGSPFVTAASMRSPRVLLDEHSSGDSRARRSPKRRASDGDMSGEERRSRKRPRSLCSRLFSYLPRPLRMLRPFKRRGYWRGARRRSSSISRSRSRSMDLAAHAPEASLADSPAEAEEQATSGSAVMEQNSVFLPTLDATRDEAADVAIPEIAEPAQHEAARDAACTDSAPDSTRVPIKAAGIFLTEDIAADDELSEEEKALLALADAEEQARMAIAQNTQVSCQSPCQQPMQNNLSTASALVEYV